MKIGTAVFTYNRSSHTEQVLSALKDNYVLPEKLFLFHDGLRYEKDRMEWEKVQKLIDEVDWCNKEIIVSNTNKGLANSIVSGVDYMFEACDAVIVLEDDCVPTRSFLDFMYQSLSYYECESNVYGISGYSWPIDIKNDFGEDVYFTGRISSWGWGTWKNRWKLYKRDDNIIKELRYDRQKSIDLEMWGSDLERMLYDTIEGRVDSWAVYWSLICIKNRGAFVIPYTSYINNIGFDGTGVNCAVSNDYMVHLEESVKNQYVFASKVKYSSELKKAFAPFLGSYTALFEEKGITENDKEKIIVYGLGGYFKSHEKYLNEHYEIVAVMDKNKHGFYAGKKILRPIELHKYKVIIMIKDRQECIDIKNMICEESKDFTGEIVLGVDLFG